MKFKMEFYESGKLKTIETASLFTTFTGTLKYSGDKGIVINDEDEQKNVE